MRRRSLPSSPCFLNACSICSLHLTFCPPALTGCTEELFFLLASAANVPPVQQGEMMDQLPAARSIDLPINRSIERKDNKRIPMVHCFLRVERNMVWVVPCCGSGRWKDGEDGCEIRTGIRAKAASLPESGSCSDATDLTLDPCANANLNSCLLTLHTSRTKRLLEHVFLASADFLSQHLILPPPRRPLRPTQLIPACVRTRPPLLLHHKRRQTADPRFPHLAFHSKPATRIDHPDLCHSRIPDSRQTDKLLRLDPRSVAMPTGTDLMKCEPACDTQFPRSPQA